MSNKEKVLKIVKQIIEFFIVGIVFFAVKYLLKN